MGPQWAPRRSFWSRLDSIWAPLGLPWASLLGPERCARQCFFVHNVSDIHFGRPWVLLKPLGVILEHLGAYLGALRATLGFLARPRTLYTQKHVCNYIAFLTLILGSSAPPWTLWGSFWNLLELIWGLLGPLWASLLGPERSVRQGLSVYSANQEATKGYWPTETSSTHDFQLRS